MDKLTVEAKLKQRAIKRPNFLYTVLAGVWKAFFYKKYNVNYTFKTDFRKMKGPYIVISNHASRLDYIFTGVPMLPAKLNYVAGYNEFHRSHLSGVFKLLSVIPKKNFTPDTYTIRQINRIIKNGGKIMIFPEGMSSISGANQPVAIGTGKFLKYFNVPVFYSVIKGGYLTSPKYNLRDRAGKVEMVFDQMFTPEQLNDLTPTEIEDIVNAKIYHDDYAWNKQEKNHYDIGEDGATDLETLLFWCPKCNSHYKMATEGNTIFCTECGNGAKLLDTYEMVPFNEECVIPETQTEWFKKQREVIKEAVKAEDFSFSTKVDLGVLPKYEQLKNQETSVIAGSGMLTIDRTGLSFKGTKDGKEFNFHLDSYNVPTYGMCTDISRFYTFLDGQFLEFYPETNVVEKFFIATEEIHRINGGKWQDFKNN